MEANECPINIAMAQHFAQTRLLLPLNAIMFLICHVHMMSIHYPEFDIQLTKQAHGLVTFISSLH